MNNHFKLVYFDSMSVAEPIRWLLSYGKLPFEDIRITQDEWENRKIYTPFGAIPTLEFGGNVMHQSVAICRYLANLVGLAGDNEWENYVIDATVDTLSDVRAQVASYNKIPIGETKHREQMKAQLINESLPFYLLRLEQTAENNGFLANQKLSWADIVFVSLLDYTYGVLKTDIVDKQACPTLDKIRKHVLTIPSITKWIQTRPTSEY